MTYNDSPLDFMVELPFIGFFYQISFYAWNQGQDVGGDDDIFSKPSRQLVKENIVGMKDLLDGKENWLSVANLIM